jgi:hypothetical protein
MYATRSLSDFKSEQDSMGNVGCRFAGSGGAMFPFCLCTTNWRHIALHTGLDVGGGEGIRNERDEREKLRNPDAGWWDQNERLRQQEGAAEGDVDRYVFGEYAARGAADRVDTAVWWQIDDASADQNVIGRCPNCDERFFDEEILKAHVEASCAYWTCRCGEGFKSASELYAHQGREGHNEVRPLGQMTKSARFR